MSLAAVLPPEVGPVTALLLVALSFFTSALTAAFGIGGGMTMLGALAGTVSPQAIIAVHAVVQLFSNLGRTIIQRVHVAWPVIRRFTLGSMAGVALGGLVFSALPPRLLLGLIGGFILLIVVVPKPNIPGLARAGVVAGGFASSVATMFVGATGPFVQAMLLPLGLSRQGLIATHAMAMTVQHGLKIVVFGALGFSLWAWSPLLAAMVIAGFGGTLAGTALLARLPERLFKRIVEVLLVLIALDLLRRAAGF